MTVSWFREQIYLFINDTENYPCQYVVKSINYKHKRARVDALEKFLSELRCCLSKS